MCDNQQFWVYLLPPSSPHLPCVWCNLVLCGNTSTNTSTTVTLFITSQHFPWPRLKYCAASLSHLLHCVWKPIHWHSNFMMISNNVMKGWLLPLTELFQHWVPRIRCVTLSLHWQIFPCGGPKSTVTHQFLWGALPLLWATLSPVCTSLPLIT